MTNRGGAEMMFDNQKKLNVTLPPAECKCKIFLPALSTRPIFFLIHVTFKETVPLIKQFSNEPTKIIDPRLRQIYPFHLPVHLINSSGSTQSAENCKLIRNRSYLGLQVPFSSYCLNTFDYFTFCHVQKMKKKIKYFVWFLLAFSKICLGFHVKICSNVLQKESNILNWKCWNAIKIKINPYLRVSHSHEWVLRPYWKKWNMTENSLFFY